MNQFRVTSLLLILAAFAMPRIVTAVKLTIYDDGRACPANCDAHVVFHSDMNGTHNAHRPQSSAPDFKECAVNSICEICFEQSIDSCVKVMYRGPGPGKNTFDFTPAFYEEWCAKQDILQQLKAKCSELERTASRLDGRINCIKQPDHQLCEELMFAAKERKMADTVLYDECLRVRQSTFNRTRPKSEKRIINCGYEFEKNGGPNSRGLSWHKLRPGTCRDGTYVGRDGLDCCSGSPFVDGALGIECSLYYPKP